MTPTRNRDPLDLRSIVSATVALHRRNGLVRESHLAGMITSRGTAEPSAGTRIGSLRAVLVTSDSLQAVVSAPLEVDATTTTFGVSQGEPMFGLEVPYELGRHGGVMLLRAEDLVEDDLASWQFASHETIAPSNTRPTRAVGTIERADEVAEAEEGLEAQAQALARRVPAVDVARPEVPALGEDPLDNARALFALTVSQLARLLGVSDRQLYRWQERGLPEDRRTLVNALVAVGLMVVGGLGPLGAQRWLDAGDPSPAQLLSQERIDELSARAEVLADSPAM